MRDLRLPALDEGLTGCPEMPRAETLMIVRQKGSLRAARGVRYPSDRP